MARVRMARRRKISGSWSGTSDGRETGERACEAHGASVYSSSRRGLVVSIYLEQEVSYVVASYS